MIKTITVHLGERSYQIAMGKGLLARQNPAKEFQDRDAAIITDRRIYALLQRGRMRKFLASWPRRKYFFIPTGEAAKTLKTAERLILQLSRWDVRRRPLLIALGGGAVGDLTGFVASIYKRGIPYVQIPTTLLAQVDSSIGGKVAVDLLHGKNLLGSFHQPRAVWCDLNFLNTLPERELRSGMGEVIKYGAILDRPFLYWLSKHRKDILARRSGTLLAMVNRCAQWKARIVEEDERDTKGLRTLLNFGHTIGHALETASGYHRTWTHGEAISVGMIAAARLSNGLGLLPPAEVRLLEDLLNDYGLPIQFPRSLRTKVLTALSRDKKFVHRSNRLVLLSRLGHAIVVDKIPTLSIAQSLS